MGSGRSLEELTQSAKKAREIRRREKNQRQRLAALGMSEEAIAKLNARQVRQLLMRPKLTQRRLAGKT